MILGAFFPFFAVLSFCAGRVFGFVCMGRIVRVIVLISGISGFIRGLVVNKFTSFYRIRGFLRDFSLVRRNSADFIRVTEAAFSKLVLPMSTHAYLVLPVLSSFVSDLSFYDFL